MAISSWRVRAIFLTTFWRRHTNSTCAKHRCNRPTTGSAMPSPGCPSFRTTRSIWTSSTAASTGRSSAWSVRPSRQTARASISAAARASSPTRCYATTYRCKAGSSARTSSRPITSSTSGIATRRTSCLPRLPATCTASNKANFAILYWFGLRFEPRFTDLETQLKELYCADDLSLYEKCLICPVGQIDRQAIVNEKANIDQIVATLGLKEITQGTLIRKLCTYTQPNPTRRAIFEFDKLIRSIYTLRYLRYPQLQRNVHRSQNRIESYHRLEEHTSE